MLIKITSPPAHVLKLCEKPFRLVAIGVPPRNERLRRALPLKPIHLEGIYVVYNNEIDLT